MDIPNRFLWRFVPWNCTISRKWRPLGVVIGLYDHVVCLHWRCAFCSFLLGLNLNLVFTKLWYLSANSWHSCMTYAYFSWRFLTPILSQTRIRRASHSIRTLCRSRLGVRNGVELLVLLGNYITWYVSQLLCVKNNSNSYGIFQVNYRRQRL